MKKTSVKGFRDKCDRMLTPIIKKREPRCLLCPNQTEVAHHHVHKSKSTRLRYEMENLIPLCHSCHLALHMNESYHASRIVDIKGLEWFRKLERKKNEIVKADINFYADYFIILSKMLDVDN